MEFKDEEGVIKKALVSTAVIKVTPKSGEVDFINDFVEKMSKMGIREKFDICPILSPVHEFRHEFLDYIAEHGLSRLFKFDIVMEDITSRSMPIDEIEEVVTKFVKKLQGAKKLIIIDPYFFAKSTRIDVGQLFSRLLSQVSSDLEEICFITNGRKNEAKTDILAVIDRRVEVHYVTTDEFHDRYWIDPITNKGIIMGTSLNGLGNKICLIDCLREEDVAKIAELAKELGSPI
ncbi:hypothetical protein [Thioflexithrix psekupsensis]|uniref:Uncharacterized protein n=1 Tax=Thioflexithrix psekupsensis TaxID=1570016 RepID=A0A251X9X9_9GAMM|nr:hypothetical protein [Thioflexithrix psekupsensis]OUD14322.1 hypothetical protein TPSD3_08350 [Thioflexithrix psekupsensis]